MPHAAPPLPRPPQPPGNAPAMMSPTNTILPISLTPAPATRHSSHKGLDVMERRPAAGDSRAASVLPPGVRKSASSRSYFNPGSVFVHMPLTPALATRPMRNVSHPVRGAPTGCGEADSRGSSTFRGFHRPSPPRAASASPLSSNICVRTILLRRRRRLYYICSSSGPALYPVPVVRPLPSIQRTRSAG